MNISVAPSFHALVVDDKSFVRTMMGRLLKSIGIQSISYSSNGKDAVAALRAAHPPIDLMFCDLMMPDMDGIEVVRHVAELDHKPMFIFISGANAALLSTATDMATARGLRVLGAIEKPVSIDAVRNLLANIGGKKSAHAASKELPISAGDIRAALDREQILLHYQPKVDLKTRAVVGYEALVRWQHPQHGLIPPGQFVALAEESGAISALTDRVLTLALRQCSSWSRNAYTTKLSVNISAHLLVDLDMPDRIAKEADEHGVKPEQIILEITESGVLGDTANTLDILARLHLKGFLLSIDDFGTGYSSMEQLRRVPFSELKIDRAFVNGAAQNSKARAILESSAVLARRLGLSIVAEGAETQDDWNLLKDAGIDIVQGFFVAKAMPHELVVDWSKNWSGGD